MATAAGQAITNASRLSEIAFPEFTAKLITDTFDAITASYISQMGTYTKLIQAVSNTLQDYIANTADEISAEEIAAFLLALGSLNDAALDFLLGDSAAPAALTAAEAGALNAAVAVPAAVGAPAAPATNGALTSAKQQTIAQAVARRIAANRYDLLQTMVRQGMLRLYVDNGTIETRLTFSTYGQSVSSSSSSLRTRVQSTLSASGNASVGGGLPALLVGTPRGGAEAASSASFLAVSTSKESQRDVSGSRVQIFGRVKLNFKTDFVPLAAAGA